MADPAAGFVAGRHGESDKRAPVGVVLAAGRGGRFGGAKQLALLDGRALVAHAVATLAAAGLPVVVVVGPGGRDGDRRDADSGDASEAHGADGAVADAARSAAPDVCVVVNPDPSRGMGSSLSAAVEEVGARPVVVLLADQPRVPVADVETVVAALGAGAEAVQVAFRDGGRGHPVGFGAALHHRLLVLEREGGGRGLLADAGPVLVHVDHDRPRDVDTRADLADLVEVGGGVDGTVDGGGDDRGEPVPDVDPTDRSGP